MAGQIQECGPARMVIRRPLARFTARVSKLYSPLLADVAQLARASPCHGEGRGFESHHPLYIGTGLPPSVQRDRLSAVPCPILASVRSGDASVRQGSGSIRVPAVRRIGLVV